MTRYPLYRELGRPQGRPGPVRITSPPPEFDPRTLQPAVSCITIYNSQIQHLEDSVIPRIEQKLRTNKYLSLYNFSRLRWDSPLTEIKTSTWLTSSNGRWAVKDNRTKVHFRNSRQPVYLGSFPTNGNNISEDVDASLIAANNCYFGLQRHLRSKLLSRKPKITLYRTLVRSVLLNGCETWTISDRRDSKFLKEQF